MHSPNAINMIGSKDEEGREDHVHKSPQNDADEHSKNAPTNGENRPAATPFQIGTDPSDELFEDGRAKSLEVSICLCIY